MRFVSSRRIFFFGFIHVFARFSRHVDDAAAFSMRSNRTLTLTPSLGRREKERLGCRRASLLSREPSPAVSRLRLPARSGERGSSHSVITVQSRFLSRLVHFHIHTHTC